MDRGAWQATVHGVARVGHDWVTKERERERKRDFFNDSHWDTWLVSCFWSVSDKKREAELKALRWQVHSNPIKRERPARALAGRGDSDGCKGQYWNCIMMCYMILSQSCMSKLYSALNATSSMKPLLISPNWLSSLISLDTQCYFYLFLRGFTHSAGPSSYFCTCHVHPISNLFQGKGALYSFRGFAFHLGKRLAKQCLWNQMEAVVIWTIRMWQQWK